MAATRLGRQEAKAQTRERLLDAAAEVFAEKGFAAATLEEIAAAAGYTRGALYYNFADKDELFVAVLDRRIERSVDEISGMLRASDDPAEFFSSLRARGYRRRWSPDIPRWAVLEDEFWLYAVRNPEARAKLAHHRRHQRAAYAAGISGVFDQLGIAPPMPLNHIAALVFALDESLPRQHWLNPEQVPESAFFDVLELLLAAAVALDAQRKAGADASKEPAGG